jgi:hypothetical protein
VCDARQLFEQQSVYVVHAAPVALQAMQTPRVHRKPSQQGTLELHDASALELHRTQLPLTQSPP